MLVSQRRLRLQVCKSSQILGQCSPKLGNATASANVAATSATGKKAGKAGKADKGAAANNTTAVAATAGKNSTAAAGKKGKVSHHDHKDLINLHISVAYTYISTGF